jgi:XTP/dITP diphosphohydrolase
MHRIPAKILIATTNQGKVQEIRKLSEVPGIPEVVEDGATFEENALKKARMMAYSTGMVTLADDSGLCVDALDGRPGVHSARYAGDNASDEEKYLRVLEEMEDVPDPGRSARFVCALALAAPDGEPRGSSGFGYDPIFYFEEAGCTFAEMDGESKNRVSHRGRALRQFAEFLRRIAE